MKRKRGGRPETFPGYLALSLDPCFTVKMADEHDKMRCKIMRKTDSKQFSNKQQQRGRHFDRKNATIERFNEKCDETKLGVLAPLEILAHFPKRKRFGLLWKQREYPSFCKITENGKRKCGICKKSAFIRRFSFSVRWKRCEYDVWYRSNAFLSGQPESLPECCGWNQC